MSEVEDMKNFEIWTEGYAATGERAASRRLGTGLGHNFAEAVTNWYNVQPDAEKRLGKLDFASDGRPSIWGCRLFETWEEARKSFG